MTRDGHWSAPSLEQIAELSLGQIPREFHSEEELTPQARSIYQASRQDLTTCSHGAECRKSLNPLFVEWLMGWPIGLTGSDSLGTEWSQWWQQWRSWLCERGFADAA